MKAMWKVIEGFDGTVEVTAEGEVHQYVPELGLYVDSPIVAVDGYMKVLLYTKDLPNILPEEYHWMGHGYGKALFTHKDTVISSEQIPLAVHRRPTRKYRHLHVINVSTLVAKAFLGIPEKSSYVVHKDGNWRNCEATNLFWQEQGTFPPKGVVPSPTTSPVSGCKTEYLLTDEERRKIINLYTYSDIELQALADRFGVSTRAIYKVVEGLYVA